MIKNTVVSVLSGIFTGLKKARATRTLVSFASLIRIFWQVSLTSSHRTLPSSLMGVFSFWGNCEIKMSCTITTRGPWPTCTKLAIRSRTRKPQCQPVPRKWPVPQRVSHYVIINSAGHARHRGICLLSYRSHGGTDCHIVRN